MQYNTKQYNPLQQGKIQSNVIEYMETQPNAIQYNPLYQGKIQSNVIEYMVTQPSAATVARKDSVVKCNMS